MSEASERRKGLLVTVTPHWSFRSSLCLTLGTEMGAEVFLAILATLGMGRLEATEVDLEDATESLRDLGLGLEALATSTAFTDVWRSDSLMDFLLDPSMGDLGTVAALLLTLGTPYCPPAPTSPVLLGKGRALKACGGETGRQGGVLVMAGGKKNVPCEHSIASLFLALLLTSLPTLPHLNWVLLHAVDGVGKARCRGIEACVDGSVSKVGDPWGV